MKQNRIVKGPICYHERANHHGQDDDTTHLCFILMPFVVISDQAIFVHVNPRRKFLFNPRYYMHQLNVLLLYIVRF